MALAAADPAAAQLVACEMIVLAETKDHANWELIGACAKGLHGDEAAVLHEAYEEVEDEEDEHLYHTKGWCRELWLQSPALKQCCLLRKSNRRSKLSLRRQGRSGRRILQADHDRAHISGRE